MINLVKIDSAVFDAPKRPRGRPRKNPIEQVVSVVPKRRGRPPKVQTPVETLESQENEPTEETGWIHHNLWARAHYATSDVSKHSSGIIFKLALCAFPYALEPKVAPPSATKCEACLGKIKGKPVL